MTVFFRNGKYYSRFQVNGERHNYACVGATNKKEALRLENAFKLKVMTQQVGFIQPTTKHVKMSLLYGLYETYSKHNKRSYKSDYYMLPIVKEFFGDSDVKDITLSSLEHFKAHLLVERKVAPSTVNRYKALLSKMFNLAVANKLIKDNPAKDMSRLLEKNYKIRFLTKEEEVRLFKAMDSSPDYLKHIVTMALLTGMRKGEILNLKWSNIDMVYGFIELLETKSGRSRRIPISKRLMSLLVALDKTSEYVFTIEGNRIGDIKKCWNTAIRNARISNFRFHDLRHTFATRLVEKGVELVVVKELLGHADISTTMRYAHAVPNRKILAVNMLDSY